MLRAVGAAGGSSGSLSPYIARGLDYYTGTIYETFPTPFRPNRQRSGSGGRYDNPAELFTSRPARDQRLLGLRPLLAAMEELG